MFDFEPIESEVSSPACRNYCKVHVKNPSPALGEILGANWTPRPVVMTDKYETLAEKIKKFEVRSDDVWIVTYPKCGTTWAQEMIWLICNDLNFTEAKAVSQPKRFPFLEITGISDTLNGDSVSGLVDLSSPRFIKSHLPASLLPDQLWTQHPRIVYVARNPKDVAISYLHHYKMIVGYRGPDKNFLDAFLNDQIMYSPLFHHMTEFWTMRNRKNILFLTYEEMKRNMSSVLRKTSAFFNKHYDDGQLLELENHLSFDSMKSNNACNMTELTQAAMNMNGRAGETFEFIRKGKIGSHKEEMSPEYIDRFNAWIERALENDADLKRLVLDE